MSESRDARKPAAPARPAAPPNRTPIAPRVGSPRPPTVSGAVRGRMPSAPMIKNDSDAPVSESGWEAAEAIAPETPRPTPTPSPSPAAAPRAKSVPPPAPTTSPNPASQTLTAPMREEVWAIVRAAVDEATKPLLAKQKELEARLEKSEREARSRPAAPAPQAISVAPEGSATAPVVRPSYKSVRLSVPPGVYGVAVLEQEGKKPQVDTSNVGPIEVDFGGSRRGAKIVVGLLVLGVVAAIVATLLSHA